MIRRLLRRLLGREARDLRERLDAAGERVRDLEGQLAEVRVERDNARYKRERLREKLNDACNARNEEAERAAGAIARASRMEHAARAVVYAAQEVAHECRRDLGQPCRFCAALDNARAHIGARPGAPHYGDGEAVEASARRARVQRLVEYAGPTERVERALASSLPIGRHEWGDLTITIGALD